MTPDPTEFFRYAVQAAAAAVCLAAVVVCEADAKAAVARIDPRPARLTAGLALRLVLALVGMGEGLTLFGAVFRAFPPPPWPQAVADTCWGLLAALVCLTRPLRRGELFCPKRATGECPVWAAGPGGRPAPGRVPLLVLARPREEAGRGNRRG